MSPKGRPATARSLNLSWAKPTPRKQAAIATSAPVVRGVMTGGRVTMGAIAVVGSWESRFDTFGPLIPGVSTGLFGSYKGEKYKLYAGFGYDEDLPMKSHPLTAWMVRRHRQTFRRNPPWAGTPVPMFGFGYGSEKIVEGGVSVSSSQQTRKPERGRKQAPPPSAQTERDGLSSAKRGSGGGPEGSRPRRRGSSGREVATSRTGSTPPQCPVHRQRHWCSVTRRIVKPNMRSKSHA